MKIEKPNYPEWPVMTLSYRFEWISASLYKLGLFRPTYLSVDMYIVFPHLGNLLA